MEQVDGSEGLFPGLNTLQDRLAFAMREGAEYLANPLDVQKAESFARSAHILAEWVLEECGAFGYKSKEHCRDDIYQRCPDLKAIRDFSNRAKHGGKLDEGRTPYFKAAKVHPGAFSKGFSIDFDVTRLVLVMPDETELAYESVVANALGFWKEFFALRRSASPSRGGDRPGCGSAESGEGNQAPQERV